LWEVRSSTKPWQSAFDSPRGDDQVARLYNLLSARFDHFELEQGRRWEAQEKAQERLDSLLRDLERLHGSGGGLSGAGADTQEFNFTCQPADSHDADLQVTSNGNGAKVKAELAEEKDDNEFTQDLDVNDNIRHLSSRNVAGTHGLEHYAHKDLLRKMPDWLANSKAIQRLIYLREWYVEHDEPEGHRCVDKFVNGQLFHAIISFVILTNLIFIIVSTDDSLQQALLPQKDQDARTVTVLEGISLTYTGIYLLELILKLVSKGSFFFSGREAVWNIFDSFLVLMSIVEGVTTDGASVAWMRSLRIIKASRGLRALRVLKFASELRMIMRCVAGSVLALFWSGVMIAFVVFLFGVFFTQEVTGTLLALHEEDGDFVMSDAHKERMLHRFGTSSVQAAMLTLFSNVTGGQEWMSTFVVLAATFRGRLAAGTFLLYFFIFFFSVFNIITAAFIEKALKLGQPETEELATMKRYNDLEDEHELRKLLEKRADLNHDMSISRREFMDFFGHPECVRFLQVRGIDIKDAQHLFSMVASTTAKEAEVEIGQLVSCLNRIKGYATSIDVHILRFEVRALLKLAVRNQHSIVEMREVVAEATALAKHNAVTLGIPNPMPRQAKPPLAPGTVMSSSQSTSKDPV
jgi:large-conductance mechanosensitive channel